MSDTQRRYLIVGPSWIGDMVMAQSLFITLKNRHPDCQIDVLAPAWSLPVIDRMPEVNDSIPADTGHGEFSFFKRRKLGISLGSRNYTRAIIIPRSWKSALVPYFADIPVRTGYRGEMRYGLLNDIRTLDRSILRQTVQRYVAHAGDDKPEKAPDIPFPSLDVDTTNQSLLLEKLDLALNKPLVCMMPGAEYGPAKQWPIEYYKKLAGELVTKGWQVWVIGSEKDAAAGAAIAEQSDDVHDLCGKTQLVDTIDLLACAESVVSNDSGLMHVAAAVDVSVNAIYGSSTPDYTPPLAPAHKTNIFYLKKDCSPCFSRTCRYKHYDCLKGIRPETVLSAIDGDDV